MGSANNEAASSPSDDLLERPPFGPASVLSSNALFNGNGEHIRPGQTFIWPPINPNQPPPFVTMINKGTESCLFKAALSGVAGGGLGLMFGLFFGGYSNAVDKAVEMEGSAGMKLRVGMREAGRAMGSYAKNFARFGVSFSAAECTVEKIRAKHDIYNSVIGGCVAGAIMSSTPSEKMPHRARATQIAMGCASVAAFSAAIDYYMEYMD